MRKFTLVTLCLLAAAVLALPSAAGATSITIAATDGTWFNMVGAPATGIDNTGTPRTAQWGTDIGNGQSGYDYTPATTPFLADLDGLPFLLGTFVHHNVPITAPSITSIQLAFSLDWGSFTPDLAGTFTFTHDETDNGAAPCAYGGANGQGVNINGCADSVIVNSPFLNTQITDGSNTYFFSLLGFSTDGGITTNSQFLTVEELTNTAGLYGTLTSVPIIDPRGLSEVPEPASLILFGSGLVGLVALRRRTRRA